MSGEGQLETSITLPVEDWQAMAECLARLAGRRQDSPPAERAAALQRQLDRQFTAARLAVGAREGRSGDSTPKGVRMIAISPDGAERNITEGVQVLYDLVIQSMDWGSGFLTVEDVRPVVDLAKWCGFEKYEEAEKYMASELKLEKQRKCSHPEWREEPLATRGAREYVKRVCVECGLARTDVKL